MPDARSVRHGVCRDLAKNVDQLARGRIGFVQHWVGTLQPHPVVGTETVSVSTTIDSAAFYHGSSSSLAGDDSDDPAGYSRLHASALARQHQHELGADQHACNAI